MDLYFEDEWYNEADLDVKIPQKVRELRTSLLNKDFNHIEQILEKELVSQN